jgi:hypothetical protein
MDGYKDSTKTHYMKGGDVSGYAKGGSVKGAAKISKVMGEFKAGKLHSGSKSGPEVTNPKQAKAIAMSEARKVMKKGNGGAVARGNRMSAEEAAESKLVGRRRATAAEPDYSRLKKYDDPSPKQRPTELSVRLTKRGPAGMRHDDTPMIDRMVGAVRDTLGFKKGGLAAMPKTKC